MEMNGDGSWLDGEAGEAYKQRRGERRRMEWWDGVNEEKSRWEEGMVIG